MGTNFDREGNHQKYNVDGSTPVSIVGSLANLAANKPVASMANVGWTYWSVDTDPHGNAIEMSNGTAWVVI